MEGGRGCYSHPEDTMLTTMEEEVLELCTRTVSNTPITSPAIGFDSTALSLKISPATLPIEPRRQTERESQTCGRELIPTLLSPETDQHHLSPREARTPFERAVLEPVTSFDQQRAALLRTRYSPT